MPVDSLIFTLPDLAATEALAARDGIVIVEWPQRLEYLTPPGALHLRLEPVEGDLRTVTLFGWGARMDALLP